jgi:hypothetical protein
MSSAMQAQQQVPVGSGAIPNAIHIEISWNRGGKAKSVYMKKPPHYLDYQLLVDIQAQTGFPADKHELYLGGATLAWHDRLCSAGVVDGEVLVLKVCTPS